MTNHMRSSFKRTLPTSRCAYILFHIWNIIKRVFSSLHFITKQCTRVLKYVFHKGVIVFYILFFEIIICYVFYLWWNCHSFLAGKREKLLVFSYTIEFSTILMIQRRLVVSIFKKVQSILYLWEAKIFISEKTLFSHG